MTPPSGEQFEITDPDAAARAVITEVGAALRVFEVAGREVIVPFGEDELSPAGHGAVLAPWPNRLGDGRYAWDGVTYQLPISEPRTRTALHGLVRWERWSAVRHGAHAVTLRLDTVPLPGYPWPLTLEVTYALQGAALAVTLTATNHGASAAPYGAGFHPWLSPGPGGLDAAVVQIDAERWVRPDARLLPTEVTEIPPSLDAHRPRQAAGLTLDDAFVSPTRDDDGRSWIRLTGSDGRTAAAWMDHSLRAWQVCTGDDLDVPGYSRTGLAAEPMTCVADALATGDDLIRLEPGARHTVRWGIVLS